MRICTQSGASMRRSLQHLHNTVTNASKKLQSAPPLPPKHLCQPLWHPLLWSPNWPKTNPTLLLPQYLLHLVIHDEQRVLLCDLACLLALQVPNNAETGAPNGQDRSILLFFPNQYCAFSNKFSKMSPCCMGKGQGLRQRFIKVCEMD